MKGKTSRWTLIFALTFAVQLLRKSQTDAIIFGFLALLLAFESSGYLDRFKFDGLRVNPKYLYPVIGASALYLYLAPRHHPFLGGYFLLLALFLFLAVWRRKANHKKLNKREFACAMYWSALAFILAIWELAAMLLSAVVNDDAAFPTLSVLVIPNLDTAFSKAQFLALWLGSGIYFARKWRNHGT